LLARSAHVAISAADPSTVVERHCPKATAVSVAARAERAWRQRHARSSPQSPVTCAGSGEAMPGVPVAERTRDSTGGAVGAGDGSGSSSGSDANGGKANSGVERGSGAAGVELRVAVLELTARVDLLGDCVRASSGAAAAPTTKGRGGRTLVGRITGAAGGSGSN